MCDVRAMRDARVRFLAVTGDARGRAIAVHGIMGVGARGNKEEAVRYCPVLS